MDIEQMKASYAGGYGLDKDEVEYLFAQAARLASVEQEKDEEVGRWQEAIRGEVVKCSGASDCAIDGSGCDSGDPLDLSLAEIAQGFAHVEDLLAATEKERDDLRERYDFDIARVRVLAKVLGCESALPNDSTIRGCFGTVLGIFRRSAEELKTDRDRLVSAIELDRSTVVTGLEAIRKAIRGREWLRLGRGSYEYDDQRWMDEFGEAIDEITKAMEPLEIVAKNFTNCPETQQGVNTARQLLTRAELAEKEIAILRAAIEVCRKNEADLTAQLEREKGERERLEQELQQRKDNFSRDALDWRGINEEYGGAKACNTCGGSGLRGYANTTTWRGGCGGQAITSDVCDKCWGSGDLNNKGADLRRLTAELQGAKRELAAALEEVERLKREVDHYKRGEEKSFAWDAKCLRRLATLVGVSTPESDETLCLTAEATVRYIYRAVHDQLAAAQLHAEGQWKKGMERAAELTKLLADQMRSFIGDAAFTVADAVCDLEMLLAAIRAEANTCQFCGTVNDAHHSAECIDRRAEADQPAQGEGGKP